MTAIDAFLAVFELFMSLIRNLAIKPVPFIIENASPKLYRTYRENRMSKSSLVLDLWPGVYRVLFSTSVEHIPKDTECPARVSQKVMNIQPNDFLDFWHEVRH